MRWEWADAMPAQRDVRIIELRSAIAELTHHKGGWVGAKREWFDSQNELVRFLVAPHDDAAEILRNRLAVLEAA